MIGRCVGCWSQGREDIVQIHYANFTLGLESLQLLFPEPFPENCKFVFSLSTQKGKTFALCFV